MEELRRYLAAHHGVITLAKARELGLSEGQVRYRLRTSAWVPMAPKVYRLATAPDSWSACARAYALSARGVVSHVSALVVWRIDGDWPDYPIHVAVPAGRRPRNPRAIIHRIDEFDRVDARVVDAVPVTGPARTIINAAGLLTLDELDTAIDSVIRQRLTSIPELVTELDKLGCRGRTGAAGLRHLLDKRSPRARVPDSRFNRLVGQLLVNAGLPEPAYEWNIERQGVFIGRADLAYPAAKLAIECDSEEWHRNRRAFIADPRRKNAMLLAGYRVLSFTWDDYARQPNGLVETVRLALAGGLDVHGE